MSTLIPDSEAKAVLLAFNNLPPDYWLPYLSQDQLDHWHSEKNKFQLLHQELKAYFSGNANVLSSLDLSPESRNLIARLRDYYLALYALLREGWEVIKQSTKDSGGYFKFENPGQLLITIIENDANASIYQSCVPSEFQPRKRYELYRTSNSISKALADGVPITKIETTKDRPLKPNKRRRNTNKTILDCYREDVMRDEGEMMQFADLELHCLRICREPKNLNETESLKHKLADYDREAERLNKLQQQGFRQGKAYAWRNGKKLQSRKAGGTYES